VYAWALQYSLIRIVDYLICSCWSFDGYVVDVGNGDMRDFSLQDEGDIVVEDRY
jgi:hypothetical protein